MCGRPDSQEVGLEAATLERVRNSSLVECARADNGSGLKLAADAADACPAFGRAGRGRGAFPGRERGPPRAPGGRGSANAGMSSVEACEKHAHRNPEGSDARYIRVGLVGPKPRAL